MSNTLQERLEAKYMPEPNSGCWLWVAAIDANGYGRIGAPNWRDGTLLAHRASYELFKGPIPADMHLDHKCRIRSCVNPDHLDPVPLVENTRRGLAWTVNASKTHCPQGHEYTRENTTIYVTPVGKERRHCKACNNERIRRRRAR